ncbi:MAG: helix-turn-helix domain-containing protein [Oscillospiraceae bacterium]|nr:helix-turn-helix domain-containing protein [Oscillospiraceae bacterium]
MNVLFDQKQLYRLVTNLHALTGIAANILDPQGRDINLFEGHPPFCQAINALPAGHRRCVDCDACKVRHYDMPGGFQFYRCHAGICEAVMPLYDKKRPLAYLIFGCYLDDSPLEEQWDRSRALLDWYPGGPEALRPAFFQFRQYNPSQLKAYAELLEALADYIQLKGMISTAERTDLQKLELYLNDHYMEKLSLASISAQLHIGRTKLCRLAKELSGGHSLTYLIAQRRIEAAKTLLLQSDASISAVADAVGISDYNYFSRVFRASTGMTPRAFRESGRQSGQSFDQNG